MDQLTVSLYSLNGKTDKTIKLDPTIFGVTPNSTLVHQAFTTFMANKRVAIADTKDRSQVRGGGKKPWRQKGTGNARVGSIRSPLWRGGGITFGPTRERNFSRRLPQKMRQAALKSILSSKVLQSQLIALDSLDGVNGKTQQWVESAQKLPSPDQGKLVVSLHKHELANRAIRNIPNYKYLTLEGLTIYDLLRFPFLVITQDAIETLSGRLKAQQRAEARL